MKKYIYITLAALLYASSLIRCAIDETVFDRSTTETFIQSEVDALAVLEGVYGQFCYSSGNPYRDWVQTSIATGFDLAGTGQWATYAVKNYQTNDQKIADAWSHHYRTIKNANTLIGYFHKNTGTTYGNRISGEGYFFRGLCYFDLVRWFGRIPVITEPMTPENLQNPRMPVDSVYAVIISDLTKASKTLPYPDKMPANEKTHVCKGGADGLLSLAYLTFGNYCDLNNRSTDAKKYYQLAKNYADTVIASGKYKLANKYENLFDLTLEEVQNNVGGELLYSIRYTPIDGYQMGSYVSHFCLPTDWWGVSGNTAQKKGAGVWKIQPFFYDRYTSGDYTGDYRAEVNMPTSFPYQNVVGKTKWVYPKVPASTNVQTDDQSPLNFPFLGKFRDGNGLSASLNGMDFILIRLAEVYLIKAEAENELNGPTVTALDAFNAVRARARNAKGTSRLTPADLTLAQVPTKEDFRMKIFDERCAEFVGEGKVLFDELRMRYKDNKRTMMEYLYSEYMPSIPSGPPIYNVNTKTWGGGRTEPECAATWQANGRLLLWPIPDAEMNSNPALKGDQNPGW